MEEEGIDPSLVNRNPQLIRAAQEEIATMDVLVCGRCHFVFHFIEEFQEHKLKNECSTPVFKGNLSEPKPQVWAFLLWKSAQAKTEGQEQDQVSSWKLYQRWCKMPDNIRETWISAGKAIQVSTTLATARMQEVKTTKPPPITYKSALKTTGQAQAPVMVRKVVRTTLPDESVVSNQDAEMPEEKKLVAKEESNVALRTEDKREDTADTTMENGAGDAGVLNESVEIKEEQVSEAEVTFEEDDDEDEEERRRSLEGGISVVRPQLPTVLKKKTDGDGKPTLKPTSKEGFESEDEYVVERIVSRRYNIRKKAYEYLLKWEGYPEDQNTWEPAENLADCKHLLENFERNLAKQKQLNAQGKDSLKRGPSGLPPGPKMITTGISLASKSSKEDSSDIGRPVRSSKKKAMDQVKAWCGSMSTKKEDGMREVSDMSDEDDPLGRKLKRSSDSEDMSQYDGLSSDEQPGKRRKQEDGEYTYVRKGPGRPRKFIKVNGLSGSPVKTSNNDDLAKTLLGELITGLEGSGDKSKMPIVLGKKPDGTTSASQQPVLVANSKGVVKVDPRSMPNITSGVYIMSTKPGTSGSGLVKIDQLPSNNVKVVTGAGQKQGGIMALKDTKIIVAEGGDSNSSPIKSTILGTKKLTPVTSTSSHLTPMKLMPKLVSPQIKGGLVKLPPNTRPGLVSIGGTGPRPLVSPSVKQGLVRTPLGSRPSLLSPKTPTLQGARPLGGIKSGIRPIEALLGAGAGSAPATTAATSLPSTPISVPKDSGVMLLSGAASVKKSESIRGGLVRGRGRGRGGRIGETRQIDDTRLKQTEADGINIEILEDRSVESDSDSDCGISDGFPTGDLPPIEPPSPERPLTLCPLTGKILSRAEGENTPPPTPPPQATSIPVSQQTPTTNTVLLDGGDDTLIKVEMSPGGTTGTVIGDESTTLIRTSSGLTVKRMPRNSPNRSGLLSTVTEASTKSEVQEISLPTRKLFTEDGQEIVTPQTEIMTIQGPDGVLYQVQGGLSDGPQTLLVQGEDGEQRCLYVTTNQEGEDGSTVLTLDSAYADAVAQLDPNQVSVLGDGSQLLVQNEDGTTTLGDTQLMSVIEAGDSEEPQAQIVAQVVRAEEAPPGGGPRNVVLLLPDGNLMVTEVDEEQYAALELDK